VKFLLFAIACIGLCFTGCEPPSAVANKDAAEEHNHSPTEASGIAVVDLDAVARRIGRDIAMNDSLQNQEGSLNEELATVQKSYLDQIASKENEFGAQPNEEQLKTIQAMKQQANLKLNQARQEAVAKLSTQRTQMIAQFREETKPVARRVAAERGLGIVVTKNDNVIFAYDAKYDITDEVVARMTASSAGGNRGAASTANRGMDTQR